MTIAMIYTILADVLPAAERGQVFYSLQAFGLLLGVAIHPCSAYLLSIDPWLPIWLGSGLFVVSTLLTLGIPETLVLRQKADAIQRHETSTGGPGLQDPSLLGPMKLSPSHAMERAWFSLKNDSSHIWRFIFGSKTLMMMIAAYSLFYPVRVAMLITLLQYMRERFDLSWSTVSICLRKGFCHLGLTYHSR